MQSVATKNNFSFKLPFSSVVDVLENHAKLVANKTAFRFLANGEDESRSATYGDLKRRATAIAAKLQLTLEPKDRVLIILPNGIEFIEALLGCMMARIIGVPVYLPTTSRHSDRLSKIIEDCKPRQIITNTRSLELLRVKKDSGKIFSDMKITNVDEISDALVSDFNEQDVLPVDIALLQYTSGSTADPKGVMVAHENILANIEMIASAMQFSRDTIFVSWLPMFHDMGLIGCVLAPLLYGVPSVLMPPLAFLEKPWRWLRAISNYKATLSGAPNFAFDLCVKKISEEQCTKLDLSSLKILFNGSEPISPDTMHSFVDKFTKFGLPKNAIFPCYGLAEATLFVSGGPHLQPMCEIALDKKGLEKNIAAPSSDPDLTTTVNLVASGAISKELKVRIVDPETHLETKNLAVGEIWVSGDNVAHGYWQKPQITKETFQVQIKNSLAGNFLRTGDLGFIFHDQLFICGRLKDIIIINGVNHYPQDIERNIESRIPGLKPGGTAAFSVAHMQRERLQVAVELERHAQKANFVELGLKIALLILEVHEIPVSRIYFIKPGRSFKTSSGKIQRAATKKALANGTHAVVYTWESQNWSADATVKFSSDDFVTETNKTDVKDASLDLKAKNIIQDLQTWFAQQPDTINIRIEPHQALTDFGIDSVTVVALQGFIKETYGVELPRDILFANPTLVGLADHIRANLISN